MKVYKILKTTGIVLTSLLLFPAAVIIICWLHLRRAVKNVRRVDDNGNLYTMEYTAEYDNPLMKLPIIFIRAIGCSAFSSHNEEGDMITARNYDLPHKDAQGNPTGLNVIFKLEPKGKYSSINIADAAWLSLVGIPYTAGALDKGGASRIFLAFMPYLCMDGMNEKGLTVSILSLDVKKGETAVKQRQAGKKTITITQMLRMMLDHCADVEETIILAQKYNLTNTYGCDFHLFVTDADGDSVVMEWRYNTLYITRQELVTNFYVAFDDAEDSYVKGKLKETFVKAEGLKKDYHYGYGHGYGRFNRMAEKLDAHITDPAALSTTISQAEAMDTLAAVSQAYDGTDLTSHTQYSVIYNSGNLTAEVCVMRNYSKHYFFSLNNLQEKIT